MDFGLSKDQQLLQATVRRYLAEQCPTSRVREIMESDDAHDTSLWSGLAGMGITALAVPEEHGGLGSAFLDLAIVAEELGYAATPGPFLGSAMATIAVRAAGDAALASRWLPALSGGQAIGTIAIGENGDQWEGDRLAATASGGRLTGEKPLVPYASIADFFVVAARDEVGPGLWLVEAGGAGVEIVALQGTDMTRRLGCLKLDDAPAKRVGDARALARTIDAGLILLAADAYGGARRCLEMTRDYALEREQFGQVIGAFQAVKHEIADMAASLEPALAFWWYAAHAFDHMPEQASRHAAMAKAYLGDLYDRLARDAIELHGGIGFTWEFDLHLWFRRSVFDRSFLGESGYQRERAAALAGW
jgi:alkylation response protein AidB-like acyl-CoA dehydrogenase